jgi:hypothetical protein
VVDGLSDLARGRTGVFVVGRCQDQKSMRIWGVWRGSAARKGDGDGVNSMCRGSGVSGSVERMGRRGCILVVGRDSAGRELPSVNTGFCLGMPGG